VSRGGASHPLDPEVLEQGSGRSLRPWTAEQAVGVVVGNSVGGVLIFAAWWVSSGASTPGKQLSWVILSLVGLLAAGGANGLWLARGRRTVRLATAVVAPAARAWWSLRSPATPGEQAEGVPARPGASGLRLVSSPKMSRYHRDDCLLAVGKGLKAASRAVHAGAGRTPCEVCEP
jgi:hypothetical protein